MHRNLILIILALTVCGWVWHRTGHDNIKTYRNKKHLKNVGPIHHNEPPHAHSADVASGTVARRLRIDVHDDIDNDNA